MNATMFVRAVAHHTSRPDTRELEQAHRIAAEFHEAIAEAIAAEREIEDETAEFGHADQYWVTAYTTNLGKAAAALQKMPIAWAAILQCEMPKVKP